MTLRNTLNRQAIHDRQKCRRLLEPPFFAFQVDSGRITKMRFYPGPQAEAGPIGVNRQIKAVALEYGPASLISASRRSL